MSMLNGCCSVASTCGLHIMSGHTCPFVVCITVYILAQSQASSYMHGIARLRRMCYEVFRSQAYSACAHASQLHSHSKLHALQTLQYLKSGRCQWTQYCKPLSNYFTTIIHTNTHPQTQQIQVAR